MGLTHQDSKDPSLDLPSVEDTPLDLTPGLMKSSCGRHEKDPTMGCGIEEELLKVAPSGRIKDRIQGGPKELRRD